MSKEIVRYKKKEWIITAFYSILGLFALWIGIAFMIMPDEVKVMFNIEYIVFYKVGCLLLGMGIIFTTIGAWLSGVGLAKEVIARRLSKQSRTGDKKDE